MKRRRLIPLSAFALILGCENNRTPTEIGPTAPTDPSEIISDGAHNNGNPDFFFLPPMVPLPLHNSKFELGKFNNTLKPSLKIEICQLKPTPANAQGRPTNATGCVGADRFEPGSGGVPLKTFAPGSVKLVNLPLRENGWWNLFGLPPDGFYYVLWDTRQANLNVKKYYRIKVFIDGSRVPLGIADVDPMPNLSQWKFSLTGEVIQLIDNVLLPIPFRVEKGGGPALCGGATLCASASVTNRPPGSPDVIIQVPGPDGSAIAGVRIPPVFLPPPPGPQSVVLTIRRVNTVENTDGSRTLAPPGCHVNLPLQQFDSCFHFSTIPELPLFFPPGSEEGHQFLNALTVAVCFVLHDVDPEEDTREPWVQLWSSNPGEPARPLPTADDAEILTGPTGQGCGDNLIGFNIQPNGFRGLASAGWAKLKGGLGQLFGVRTAYAVDLGLGGLTLDFSNIGPALTAEIKRSPDSDEGVIVEPGVATEFTARMLGTTTHIADATLDQGIPTMPVEFTLGACNGNLVGTEDRQASRTTNADGSASVSLRVTSGSCTLTATGQALNETVTFTATAAAAQPILFASSLVNGGPPSDLYTVQIGVNGVDTRIGQITAAGVALTITDIALLPFDSLVGISFSQFYNIDRQTAIASLIGPIGRSDVNGLAANASGVLYASTTGGVLLRRDAVLGWVAAPGSFGGGLSSDGDLAFAPDGTLYGTFLNASGVSVLASIDVSTGAATVRGSGLGFANVWGLAFVGSNLYGLTSGAGTAGQLLQINPATGIATSIRSLAFGAGGAAFNRIR